MTTTTDIAASAVDTVSHVASSVENSPVAASAVNAVEHAAAVAQPVLTQALANLINKTVEAAQAGGQFLVDQVPDVIRQLLLYKAVESGLLCLLGLAMAVFGLAGVLITRKKTLSKAAGWLDGYGEWSGWTIVCMLCCLGFLVAGVSLAFLDWDWLEILLAPKLYLIEYATSLFRAIHNGGS